MDLHVHFAGFDTLKGDGVDVRDGHSAPGEGAKPSGG